MGNIVNSVINNCPTTLQIALGVVLGKKSLMEQFYDFSVSCSSDEVLRFKGSAAAAAFKDLNLMGISPQNDELIQVVSDNFDASIYSNLKMDLSAHMLLRCY